MTIADALALAPHCPLRAVLGLPCPTCGTLRGLLALLAGDPAAAIAYNPGVWLGVLGLGVFVLRGLWLEWRTGRFPAPAPRDARVRRRRAAVATGLVLANWAWVLWHEHTLGAN